ncbi:phospholipase A and acyltransferase 1-like [Brachyhypopomus gauderio]|uniref:phospholipase A and acyltransferase 1-like n=1 Tax=Brachyhypopomus gauderio TaxID=698409 RepID=UPI004041AC38
MADKTKPEKGDMVAFPRGPYTHYGVSDGEDNVIHFGPESKGVSNTDGIYKKEPIEDVATHGYYVCNNQDDEKSPQSPEKILEDAEAKIGEKATYDLDGFNCEKAASDLRYGEGQGVSTQVQGSMLGKDTSDHLYDVHNQFGTDTGIQRK